MIKFFGVAAVQTIFYLTLGSLFTYFTKTSLGTGLKIGLGIVISYIFILPLSAAGSKAAAFFVYSVSFVSVLFFLNRIRKEGWMKFLKRVLKAVSEDRLTLFTVLSVSIILITVAAVFYIIPMFGHDGKLMYFMRAGIIYKERISGLLSSWRLIPHNKYPLLIPLSEFLSLSLAFSSSSVFSSVIFVIMVFAFSLTVLYMYSKMGKIYIGAAVILLFLTIPIQFKTDYGLFSRYADFPLSFFAFYLFFAYSERKNAAAAALFLAVLPLVKNEGFLLMFSFIAAVLIYDRDFLKQYLNDRSKRSALLSAFLILAVSVILRTFMSSPFEETAPSSLLSNISSLRHLPKILFDSILTFIDPRLYGILNIFTAILLIRYFRRKRVKEIIIFFVLSLIGDAIVIALIGGDFYVDSSHVTARLLYQFIPLMFVFSVSEIFSAPESSGSSSLRVRSALWSMKSKWRLVFAYLFTVLILTEILFRLFWSVFYHMPFLNSSKMYMIFYPELKTIERNYKNDSSFKVLLLGASVLYKDYGNFSEDLEADLEMKLARKVEVYNAAFPAHTTLDSYYKYRLLGNKHFDAVFLYHSINELRANNVPTRLYRSDYSHYSWYFLLNSMMNDKTLRFTVIPFTITFITNSLAEKFGFRVYVPTHTPREDWIIYGRYVKTRNSYISNISKIRALAKKKHEAFFVGEFAYYIAPYYSKFLFEQKALDYGAHHHPIEIWGSHENVAYGLEIHNKALEQYSSLHGDITLIDLNSSIPKGKLFFDDVCHLTEKACSLSASVVSDSIAAMFSK